MMQSTEQLKLCLRGLQRQSHFDASQAIGWRGLYTRPRKGDIFFRVSPTSACGNCLTLVQGSTNVRKLIPSFASTLRRTVMLPSTCTIRKEQQKSNSELITNNKRFDCYAMPAGMLNREIVFIHTSYCNINDNLEVWQSHYTMSIKKALFCN